MSLNELIYKCDKCNAKWPYGVDKKDHVCKKSILDKYRIRRVDPKNIAIQKKKGKEWRSVSYHGNSLNSLISGLSELIMAQHTPEVETLREAIASAELAYKNGIDEIRRMVDEWYNKEID